MIKHGNESLVRIINSKLVSKEPLPGRSVSQKREWLVRQQRAAHTIEKLIAIGNTAYGVPHTKSVDDKNFRVLEERVPGVPMTPLLFRTLDDKTREKVIDSLAQFYADMHSLDIIPNPIEYRMEYILNGYVCLQDFIDSDMPKYFPPFEVKSVEKIFQDLMSASYETRLVQTHGDLFEGNILYDYKTQKFNVIDFTDAGTSFLHYDLLFSYTRDLGIADAVRAHYMKYRDARDLPPDLQDDARWRQISMWHRASEIFGAIDEMTDDFSYLNQSEQKQVVAQVKRQFEKLRKFEH